MDSILNVAGLKKSYKGFSLCDVSFYVPEGCIAGLIGVNGAGKTTTLRTILGIAGRDAGTIECFGMDFDHHAQEIKDRIGVVLGGDCFYADLSLLEMKNVLAPAYTEWCEKDFRDYMEQFDLNPRQKFGRLSTGMKSKYALALALSHKAEFLIMDEPTSGLDPLVRSQILEILADFMDRGGKGVLYSTHIISDLDKVADMLIMIDQGHILFSEDKDALLEQYRIVKGDAGALNYDTRKLFTTIEETPFGFTGITNQISEVRRVMPDVTTERATLEDIMLTNVKGGN